MISFMINTERWSIGKLCLRRVYLFGFLWTPFVKENGGIVMVREVDK